MTPVRVRWESGIRVRQSPLGFLQRLRLEAAPLFPGLLGLGAEPRNVADSARMETTPATSNFMHERRCPPAVAGYENNSAKQKIG